MTYPGELTVGKEQQSKIPHGTRIDGPTIGDYRITWIFFHDNEECPLSTEQPARDQQCMGWFCHWQAYIEVRKPKDLRGHESWGEMKASDWQPFGMTVAASLLPDYIGEEWQP